MIGKWLRRLYWTYVWWRMRDEDKRLATAMGIDPDSLKKQGRL